MDKRYQLITDRLRYLGYCYGSRHAGNNSTLVSAFETWVHPLEGKIRIVQIFRDNTGYEVYRPVAENTNNLQDTLDAIA